MEYLKIVEQVVKLTYDKVKRESLRETKRGLAVYLSEQIENDYKEYVSLDTCRNYYEKFIEEGGPGFDRYENKRPNKKVVDILCKYIGYENIVDFYEKNYENDDPLEIEEKDEDRIDIKKRKIYIELIKEKIKRLTKLKERFPYIAMFLLMGLQIYFSKEISTKIQVVNWLDNPEGPVDPIDAPLPSESKKLPTHNNDLELPGEKEDGDPYYGIRHGPRGEMSTSLL